MAKIKGVAMDQLYEDELYDEAIGRSRRRPILKAASLVAIAALGACGLYQGIRFTFRDTGPAPSYPQVASALLTSPPTAAPELQAASDEPKAPAARPKVELADNDAAPPADATPAVVPTDRAPLIQVAAFPAQQGPAIDPSAPAMAPATSDPAQTPDHSPP